MNQSFNFNEVRQILLNNGVFESGATVERDPASFTPPANPEGFIYFIGAVFGTNISIDNAAGTTILSGLSTTQFSIPLKLPRGFSISGTNLNVFFAEVKNIP